MKKIIGAILVVMMLVGFGNTADAVYETEEVPVALINELLDNGFLPSEDDEDIWTCEMYNVEEDDEYDYSYAYGYFDTYENVGMVSIYAYNRNGRVVGVGMYTVRWNAIDEEMETIAEYEAEF